MTPEQLKVKALPPVTKEFVEGLRKDAEIAYTKFKLLQDQAVKAETEYLEKSDRFKRLDYELAKIDGRMQRIPEKVKKLKAQPELSLDDILLIAAKLGIKIVEDEPTDEDEEIVEGLPTEDEEIEDANS